MSTFLVNVLPAGVSETASVPLVTLNSVAVAGAKNVRLTLFKRAHDLLNGGPDNPTTGLPNVTAAGAYDGYASLEFDIADPAQSTIMANVSQLSKIPGNPQVGVSTSATKTPYRKQRAVPGDTIQLANPTTGAVLATFIVPGTWSDNAEGGTTGATVWSGDSAVQNP